MRPHPRTRQRPLFTDPPPDPPVRLPPDVQDALRHGLVQWLRAVVTAIAEGTDDRNRR